MRISRIIVTALLLASLAACGSLSTGPEIPVSDGSAIVSYHTVTNDRPSSIHIGGRTFQVTKELITWDHGGSLPLQGHWGLLELRESSGTIEISLDGEVKTTVPK